MSAILDNLDDLDNKTLRAKCLEYGLPNIPITDTSRKLFIKRLRAAIEGGEKTAEKKKSRRETVHVIKVEVEGSKKDDAKRNPEIKDVKGRKAVSRKTVIGAMSVPSVEESPVKHATVTQRRRSGRTTPISQLDPIPGYVTKRKAEAIEESVEDEGHFLPVEEKQRQEEARKSRSPSLSKSPTVTTSYIRDSATDVIEIYDDDEELEDNIQDLSDEEMFEPRYTVSSSQFYETSKIPVIEKELSSRYSSSSYVANKPLSHISLSKVPTSTFSYDSKQHYNTREYVDRTPDRSTKSGYTSTIMGHMDEDIDQAKTPYLSDFARRLSRLKGDSFDTGISSPIRREIAQREEVPRYYPTTITGRRGISRHESVGESFRKFMIALDQKYHLKRNFAIVAIIFALFFLYVIFF